MSRNVLFAVAALLTFAAHACTEIEPLGAWRNKYVAPGRGTVSAHFVLAAARIEQIRAQAAGGDKAPPEFGVDVVDASGAVVAKVHKTLYVRLRSRHRST